jgi:hypothetical protein
MLTPITTPITNNCYKVKKSHAPSAIVTAMMELKTRVLLNCLMNMYAQIVMKISLINLLGEIKEMAMTMRATHKPGK